MIKRETKQKGKIQETRSIDIVNWKIKAGNARTYKGDCKLKRLMK